MPDVQGLRVFQAVAEKLSFTRAAESLGITQSAVSHHIAKLEQELGLDVFHRNGHAIVLSKAGVALQTEAEKILRQIHELPAIVRATADPEMGHLRIGASATACQYLLPDTLRELRECFPKFTLSITPGDGPQVLQWVQDEQIDVGILILTDPRTRHRIYPLFDDTLRLVINPLHPLAKLPKIHVSDLQGQRLVLYSRSSSTYQLVERHLSRLKLPIRDSIELGSIEAIKELVKLGLGLSILSQWVVQPQLDDGSLVWRSLPGPKLKRSWVIAMRSDKTPSLVEHTFIELCRAVCRQITLEPQSNEG